MLNDSKSEEETSSCWMTFALTDHVIGLPVCPDILSHCTSKILFWKDQNHLTQLTNMHLNARSYLFLHFKRFNMEEKSISCMPGCFNYLLCVTLDQNRTKLVLSRWGIFAAIAKNTLYGSKLYIFLLSQFWGRKTEIVFLLNFLVKHAPVIFVYDLKNVRKKRTVQETISIRNYILIKNKCIDGFNDYNINRRYCACACLWL